VHHPTFPVSWQEIAAAYDPRGLPFLRYYQEAGLLAAARERATTILAQAVDEDAR